jgi:hypothetical protein
VSNSQARTQQPDTLGRALHEADNQGPWAAAILCTLTMALLLLLAVRLIRILTGTANPPR